MRSDGPQRFPILPELSALNQPSIEDYVNNPNLLIQNYARAKAIMIKADFHTCDFQYLLDIYNKIIHAFIRLKKETFVEALQQRLIVFDKWSALPPEDAALFKAEAYRDVYVAIMANMIDKTFINSPKIYLLTQELLEIYLSKPDLLDLERRLLIMLYSHSYEVVKNFNEKLACLDKAIDCYYEIKDKTDADKRLLSRIYAFLFRTYLTEAEASNQLTQMTMRKAIYVKAVSLAAQIPEFNLSMQIMELRAVILTIFQLTATSNPAQKLYSQAYCFLSDDPSNNAQVKLEDFFKEGIDVCLDRDYAGTIDFIVTVEILMQLYLHAAASNILLHPELRNYLAVDSESRCSFECDLQVIRERREALEKARDEKVNAAETIEALSKEIADLKQTVHQQGEEIKRLEEVTRELAMARPAQKRSADQEIDLPAKRLAIHPHRATLMPQPIVAPLPKNSKPSRSFSLHAKRSSGGKL